MRKMGRLSRRGWVWCALTALLVLTLATNVPRSASDPVLSVQSGQGPSSQGTMVSGSVNPFSGSYSTSIPVEVLPGRNGLQPAAGISYASSNADGLAGVGWGIPSSSISRTGPHRGAPTYGPGDEFYMSLNGSGVQLIPVGGEPVVGEASHEFKTRVESWSRIVAHYLEFTGTSGQPAYTSQVESWEVWGKSGDRYIFGPLAQDTAGDYCLVFLDPTNPAAEPRRNQWMLRKVVDVDDNTMEYRYSPSTLVAGAGAATHSPGNLLPALILYGANETTGWSHFGGVRFLYEERPDKRTSYRNGVAQTVGDRLRSIVTGLLAGDDVPYAAQARRWDLVYGVSRVTGRSLLLEVQARGKDLSGVEAPAAGPVRTVFEYADYATQPAAWQAGTGAYSALPGRPFSGGFYKYGSGDTEFAGGQSYGSVLMDVNGDGLPDKVDSYQQADAGLNYYPPAEAAIYLNPGPEGTAWQPVSSPSIPGQPVGYFYVCNQYQHSTLDRGVRFADVNADGIPDKIDSGLYYGPYANSIYLGRPDGSGWEPNPAGTIHHTPNRILTQAGFRRGTATPRPAAPPPTAQASSEGTAVSAGEETRGQGGEAQLLPPEGGGGEVNTVSAQVMVGPRTQTAGGRVSLLWQGAGMCSSNPEEERTTRYYYLQGKEPTWILYTGSEERVACTSYTNLTPGSYTFRVKVVNACGKVAQASYPFTVVSSSDVTPPQVWMTQVPEDGFHEFLDFAWEGSDSQSPAGMTYSYRLLGSSSTAASGTGTSTQVTADSVTGGGTMLVMAYDGVGNMTPTEWAFGGGRLYPPNWNVEWTPTYLPDGKAVWKVKPRGVEWVDVNGDGYCDVLTLLRSQPGNVTSYSLRLFDPDTWTWQLAPSEYLTNALPLLDLDAEGSPHELGIRLMDVNGDGLPDLLHEFRVSNWTQFPPAPPQSSYWLREVRFNTGKGWSSPVTTAGTYSDAPGMPITEMCNYNIHIGPVNLDRTDTNDRGAWFMDLNGDGLPDKVDGWVDGIAAPACPGLVTRPKNVYLNNGTGFQTVSSLAPYQPSGQSAPAPDIPSSSFVESFVPTPKNNDQTVATRDLGVRFSDLDGDGLPDVVRSYNYTLFGSNGAPICSPTLEEVYLASPQNASSARLDYLVTVKNAIGGRTRIAYGASLDSYSDEPGVTDFCPQVPYVVTSITQEDGLEHAYTTRYEYRHPKYDIVERQFAGFREVSVISPDGTSSRTTYRQDFPLTGMVEKSESFAASAPGVRGTEKVQESTTTYEALEDGAQIWRVHKLSDRTTVWEETDSLTTGVDYGPFDAYDNVLEVTTLGDVTTPSDDKKVTTSYINDESRWLLGLVKQTDTWDLPAARMTSSKRLYYDGDESGPLPLGQIQKGHPTEERNWLDVLTANGVRETSGDYFAVSTLRYYQDGTLKRRADAAGIVTTISYEATKRFAQDKTVAGLQGGHYTTSATYDAWGRALEATDAKSVTNRVDYDGLGRPLVESTRYPGVSSFVPTKRYLYHDVPLEAPLPRVSEMVTGLPHGTGSVELHSFGYFDGLGRAVSTDSPGWAGQRILTENVFDPYGRLLKKSRPHFSSKSPQWIEYEYDLSSRVKIERGFGVTTETQRLSTTRTRVNVTGTPSPGVSSDHSAHRKETRVDAYGRTIEVQNDSMPAVSYEYDAMGSLVRALEQRTAGPALLVELTYDSWGRKLTYQDYDAGTPTTLTEYFYGLAGHLIRQRETVSADASQWRQTDLTYGGDLGQLTLRSGGDQSGPGALTESLTYYGSGQLLNTGELESRTDMSGGYAFSTQVDTTSGIQVRNDTVAQILGTGQSLSFSSYKDWAGRSVRSILPDGSEIACAYDAGSGLTQTVTNGSGTVPYGTFTEYDETHLKQWHRANSIQTTYTHDEVTDRLTHMASQTAQAEPRQGLDYAFYGDGQIAAVTDAVGSYSQSFLYDDVMRLTQAQGPYGTLGFAYDDVPGGGRLSLKGSYGQDENGAPANGLVQLIYDEAFPHRVTQTSDGASLLYDAWGNVVRETRADGGTLLYTYDAWNRMTTVVRRVQLPTPIGQRPRYENRTVATYLYDASGERVVTNLPSWGPGLPTVRTTFAGYEVEQDLSAATVKTRHAITGPNGVIAWKQKITGQSAYFEAVGHRSETVLASMAWDHLWNSLQGPSSGSPGAGVPSWAALRLASSIGRDLFSALSHEGRAIGLDPEAQDSALLFGLLLLGGVVLLAVSSRRARRIVESRLRKSLSGAVRRLGDASEGAAAPLGPWNVPALRLAARGFIVLFMVQGSLFFAPLHPRAEVTLCEQTFYPLPDHLGSVNTLTDNGGTVVLTQHFLPFGEDFENPKPAVTTCNSEEPWPYGFTGQFHDTESGLIYFHARYYNPTVGHFMSPDSVVANPGDAYAYDRYAYCRNNPVNLTDPTGHFAWVAALISAIIGAVQAYLSGGNPIVGFVVGFVIGGLTGCAGFAKLSPMSQRLIIAAVNSVGNTIGAIAEGVDAGTALKAGAKQFLFEAITSNGSRGGMVEVSGQVHWGRVFMSFTVTAAYRADPKVGQALGLIIGAKGAFTGAKGGAAGALAVFKYFEGQAAQQVVRQAVKKIASKNDMDIYEVDAYLEALSFLGNALTGSRFTKNFQKTGNAGVYGVNTRSEGLIGGSSEKSQKWARGVGWLFDVVDIALAYQGMPTASSWQAAVSGNSYLRGHSLGAADVNNLYNQGFVSQASLYALPFGLVAASPDIHAQVGDPVSGFFLGWILNPDAGWVSSFDDQGKYRPHFLDMFFRSH